ncbi:uncharacterized protein VTP21DRAFT_11566 [Calcarisporiella thermophila]|uniref:uncharacterized protein n=1 Tax=Calcarisporiella thermophila TaxID=911321 RepID=UPI0037430A2B
MLRLILQRRCAFEHSRRAFSSLGARWQSQEEMRTPSKSTLDKLYDTHVPTTTIEKAALAVKAGFAALFDPTRQDMVAALGETTAGGIFLSRLRDQMLSDTTSRRVLRERPVVNSQTINLDRLRQLPDGTFGREYVRFMDEEGISPDTRTKVHYVDNEELAYVMRRYRETHDFTHTLTGLPITVEGEIALKWFELTQTGLPMTLMSSLIGPLRLSQQELSRLFQHYVPWAVECGSACKPLLCVYFEERMEQNIEELRKELGIWLPPSLQH